MSKRPKTIKQVALEMYQKHYNVHFISEFLGIDVMMVKSIVLKDNPKKQFTKPEDVPDKKDTKESLTILPILKNQMAEDMSSVIKGMTLLGCSLKEIAENMGVSEERLIETVGDIEELADAYNDAKWKINIKVAETLLASLLPKKLIDRTYAYLKKNAESKELEKVLVKEVVKEIGGNVEGLFKWLEIKYPEKWSMKNKSLGDFLKEYGVALVPADVEEAKWEEMATGQQDNLKEILENEKERLDGEYSETP